MGAIRRAASVLVAAAAVAAIVPSAAVATFGFGEADLNFREQGGTPAIQAGSHPFAMTTTVRFNTVEDGYGFESPDGSLRNLDVELPAGVVGVPTATPRCSGAAFAEIDIKAVPQRPNCSDDSVVGYVEAGLTSIPIPVGEVPTGGGVPLYNLKPAYGTVAKFGFIVASVPVTIEVRLSDRSPYRVVASLTNTPQPLLVYGATVTLWGDPSSPQHDPYRGSCLAGVENGAPQSQGSCPVGGGRPPLLTLPGSCTGPLVTDFTARPWDVLASPVHAVSLTHDDESPPGPVGMSDCSALGFSPAIEAKATTDAAESGTGLDFSLEFQDQGLISPGGVAQSTVKEAEVKMPEGMTINPSAGEGLGSCTPGDLARETAASAPGAGCPDSSKLGSLHVETPLLDESIEGSVFVAQPDDPRTATPGAENPFDDLIALYFVLKNPKLGLIVKLPVEVQPDKSTGQLTIRLRDNPQLPFSRFEVHLRTGERASLVTPPTCGTYATEALLTPWATPNKPHRTLSTFEVTRGVGGAPCPSGGVPPFRPNLQAGTVNNSAGSYSPFNLRLSRSDGEQKFTSFSIKLPPGVTGRLAGIPLCSDLAIAAAASGRSGSEELAAPSCPAASQVGTTLVGAGVGSVQAYVPGKVYLAGPYNGSTLSIAAITIAKVGPFDLGTVVVREALRIDRSTAAVFIDPTGSDPLPHIIDGIPTQLREIRVQVDRPGFVLNPTSCDPTSTASTVLGSGLDFASAADDEPVTASSRFQAASCLNLGFRPKLGLRLIGGTKRGANPKLVAVLRMRDGEANVSRAQVTLPRSMFLDQAHIRTVCTRVQYRAELCPSGSIYGYAKAVTPLLDEPLEGPVYLRSTEHELPDLVAALKNGRIEIDLVGRIDSAGNGRIRNTFESVPDAPVSLFALTMQGGRKGLITNSTNACAGKHRALVAFDAHNGKTADARPAVVGARCGKGTRQRRDS